MAAATDPSSEEERAACELAKHAAFVRALARELARDHATAEDLAAAALAEACARKPGTGPGLAAWLARVVRRLAARARRGDARRIARELGSPEAERALRHEEATLDLVARLELSRAVSEAFAELDDASREVLYLRFFDDLPPRLIASHLGHPVETVKTRIKRGLARLRTRLDERYRGSRSAWRGLAFAIGGSGGGLIVTTNSKVAGLAAAAALLAVAGFVVERRGSGAERLDARAPSGTPPSLAAERDADGGRARVAGVVGPAAWRTRIGELPLASGRCIDARGEPIAGVAVLAGTVDLERGGPLPPRENLRVDRPELALARSERDGTFVVETAAADLVSLCFVRSGFAIVEVRELAAERAGNQHLDVVLTDGSELVARVVDTSGRPIEGARVLASTASGLRAPNEWTACHARGAPRVCASSELPTLEAWSDRDGWFRMPGLAPDGWDVSVFANGYGATDGEGALRSIAGSGAVVPEPIVLRRNCVFIDVVDSRSREPLARPCALLRSEHGSEAVREFVRGETRGFVPEGRLLIWPSSLSAGGAAPVVDVCTAGYRSAACRIAVDCEAEPPALVVPLDAGRDAPAIAGRVHGVAEALVEARLVVDAVQSNAHSKPAVATTSIALDGRFELCGLPPARYRIDVSSAGRARASTVVDAPVRDLAIRVEPEARLEVAALASDGSAVAWTTVTVQSLDGSCAWSRATDAEGRASFDGLPPGMAWVWLTLDPRCFYRDHAPLFAPERVAGLATSVELMPGEVVRLALPAPEVRDVLIRVTGRDAARPITASISIQPRLASAAYDDAGEREALRAPHLTDADGELRVPLHHGSYYAHVCSSGIEHTFPFAVPARGPAEITFQMPVGGGTALLSGRLSELCSGAPLEGHRVVCFVMDGADPHHARLECTTDEEGAFEFADAPAGGIALVAYPRAAGATAPAHGTASRRVTVRAGENRVIDLSLAPRLDAGAGGDAVTFRVRVVDAETGEPIAQPELQIEGEHLGAKLTFESGAVATAGAFSGCVARLPAYVFTAHGPVLPRDGEPRYERVRIDAVPADGSIELTIRLPRER